LYKGLYKNRVYIPVVPLTLYRRHSVDCRVHKLRLKAYEKKYFNKEQYPRQALGVRDWPAAKACAR